MHLALVKTLSMGYLLGLASMSLATLLWRFVRPRLAPQQRADVGFAIIFGAFSTTWLLALLIWLGVVREIIYMSTSYFHCLMNGGWGAGITGTGAAVMGISLLLALTMWLRGRTPRSPSQPLAVVSGLAVLANEGISTAGLVGCWRPAVWVNPHYWSQLTDEERELALAHERAHLLRRDNLKKLLLQFAATLYAVLPFSRDWVKHYELDCELAVDDHCRERLDEHGYKSLLARSTQFALAGHAVASGMSQADLKARLLHLHAPRIPHSRWHASWAVGSIAVALLPIGLLLSHSVTRCLLACYLGY